MKRILRYILSVYFALIFTIGNAGIPYLIHTCAISKESDYHFFVLERNDEACCFSACSNNDNVPVLIKDSCCIIDAGVIQTNIEAVSSEVVTDFSKQIFVSIFNQFQFFHNTQQNTYSAYFSNAPPILSGRQISILNQIFLC